MSRRALHGLIGSFVLAGLLVIGLAFTFDGGEHKQRTYELHFCQVSTCP